MRRPVQWKFAAKAAHGPPRRVGEKPPLPDCVFLIRMLPKPRQRLSP